MNKSTNQQGLILPLLLILIVAGLGISGYLYLGQDQSQKLISQVAVLPTSTALISITKEGFTPSTITIAKGQQVTWVNNDNLNHQVISQEEQLQLDSDILNPNDSFSATFEKRGTFTITDQLNPLQIKGVVVVK